MFRRPLAFGAGVTSLRLRRRRRRSFGSRLRRLLFRFIDACRNAAIKSVPATILGIGRCLATRHPRLLLIQHGYDRLFIAIVEFRGVERRRFAIENMLGESQHVLRNLDLADVAEIDRLVSNLIRVPERGSKQTLPRGWSMTTRSRLDRTTRPNATMSLSRMASRMTANASRATLFSGTR